MTLWASVLVSEGSGFASTWPVCATSSPSVTLSLLLTSDLIGHSWPSWDKVWSSQRYQVPTNFVKMGSFREEIVFRSSLRKKALHRGLNSCWT